MNPRFLQAYNNELAYLRELGQEFAAEHPKVAARLGMDSIEVADPYIERLIESFAFLSTRVQLKLDDEFPAFSQHLLAMVYPDYLQPTPAMGIVALNADLDDNSLASGRLVERGSQLKAPLSKGQRTACEFRTSQSVTLWPVEVVDASFSSITPDIPLGKVPRQQVGGVFRLKLRCTAGLKWNQLRLDCLRFYLAGQYVSACKVYEHLLGRVIGVVISTSVDINCHHREAPAMCVAAAGFDDEESVLPVHARSFSGYRLLKEYFTLPSKFLFVDIAGWQNYLREIDETELELTLLLSRVDSALFGSVDSSHFRLFCTPVVNLFIKHCDRVFASEQEREFHIVPDRTRPADFEIVQVNCVTGIEADYTKEVEFRPFFAPSTSLYQGGTPRAFYSFLRRKRVLPHAERSREGRFSYPGSEVYLSIVDHDNLPISPKLHQLAVEAWCSNRDLPLLLLLGRGETDFELNIAAPVKSIRMLVEPTRPIPSLAEGAFSWRLINHLSFNYLSFIDQDPDAAASALRKLLELYTPLNSEVAHRQAQGVRQLKLKRIVRRVPVTGPIVYAQGIEARIIIDEALFEGAGAFLFGKVLEVFFQRYASINSFVETVLESVQRGEIKRWPARLGSKAVF